MENLRGFSRNGEVSLKWDKVSEFNFSHFIVQRSVDSGTFKDLGKVNSKKVSKNQPHYSFSDTKAVDGVNYYRLKAVRMNGTFEFHEVVGVHVERQKTFPMDPQLV